METMLAILLALGIFVGIPCIIGFAILGAVRFAEGVRRVSRAGLVQRKPAGTEARV